MIGEYCVTIFDGSGRQIDSKEFDAANDADMYARAERYVRAADGGDYGDIYRDNGVGQASYCDTVTL